MSVWFIGATQGMGRALARCYAERGASLVILGRDPEALERSAADLRARGASAVGTDRFDLASDADPRPRVDEWMVRHGRPAVVVITAAEFWRTEDLLDDTGGFARAERMMEVNFVRTVLLIEALRPHLLEGGGATLCVFGSVAGDLARKPASLYGATKSALAHYLEGLDLRFRPDGLNVVIVKPGFIHTRMTAGADAPPFAGEPEPVAREVIRAIDRRRPVIYTPRIWRWVMLVLRHLPRFVRRRVDF